MSVGQLEILNYSVRVTNYSSDSVASVVVPGHVTSTRVTGLGRYTFTLDPLQGLPLFYLFERMGFCINLLVEELHTLEVTEESIEGGAGNRTSMCLIGIEFFLSSEYSYMFHCNPFIAAFKP